MLKNKKKQKKIEIKRLIKIYSTNSIIAVPGVATLSR